MKLSSCNDTVSPHTGSRGTGSISSHFGNRDVLQFMRNSDAVFNIPSVDSNSFKK